MPQHASTAVKAAAILLATPALLFPMKAAAQQLGANTPRPTPVATAPAPDFSECDVLARTQPAQAAQCRVDVLKARGAAADARAASARQESVVATDDTAFAEKIKADVKAGRITPEALREALAGRPAREVGGCNLLAKLTRS